MSSFYDDASLVVIPSGYKTSKVYAEKPTDGSGDLAFTRTGDTATRVNSAGIIEKVRTNKITYSENQGPTGTNWYPSTTWTVTNNTVTSPSGSQDADTLTETTSTGFHSGYFNATIDNAYTGTYTISAFAKYNGRFFVLSPKGATERTYFNLQTGVVAQLGGGGVTAKIENYGNGWYRCSVTCSFNNENVNFEHMLASAVGTLQYTGNGTSGVHIWGCMAEASDVATDYIPTTTAAVSVGPVANVPRLDYLGSTCPRLLLEPQRTNLVTYSEQFNNADWLKLGITVSANNTLSPSGYVDADKLIADAGTGNRVVYQSVVPAGVSTVSTYAKAGEFGGIVIANGTQGAFFNLITGAYRTFYGSAPTAYSITSVGNGWYRCSVTFTSASTDNLYIGPNDNVSTTLAITGNGTSGIYVWGAQLEAGAYVTSYIPTLAASATRGADACSKTGISSLIGQTEGTLFVDAVFANNYDSNNMLMTLSDGGGSNVIYINRSNGGAEFYVAVSGATQALYSGSILTAGVHKIAFAYKQNDFAMYVDGLQVATDTNGNIPACSKLNIGSYSNDGLPFNNGIRQALLFKTRLTNAALAELTTL